MRGDITVTVSTLTIERFGENTRERSFADPTCAGEQIRMVQAFLLQRMGERAHHMLLPDQAGEVFGAIFAGKYLVGHVRGGSSGNGGEQARILPDLTRASYGALSVQVDRG